MLQVASLLWIFRPIIETEAQLNLEGRRLLGEQHYIKRGRRSMAYYCIPDLLRWLRKHNSQIIKKHQHTASSILHLSKRVSSWRTHHICTVRLIPPLLVTSIWMGCMNRTTNIGTQRARTMQNYPKNTEHIYLNIVLHQGQTHTQAYVVPWD